MNGLAGEAAACHSVPAGGTHACTSRARAGACVGVNERHEHARFLIHCIQRQRIIDRSQFSSSSNVYRLRLHRLHQQQHNDPVCPSTCLDLSSLLSTCIGAILLLFFIFSRSFIQSFILSFVRSFSRLFVHSFGVGRWLSGRPNTLAGRFEGRGFGAHLPRSRIVGRLAGCHYPVKFESS